MSLSLFMHIYAIFTFNTEIFKILKFFMLNSLASTRTL